MRIRIIHKRFANTWASTKICENIWRSQNAHQEHDAPLAVICHGSMIWRHPPTKNNKPAQNHKARENAKRKSDNGGSIYLRQARWRSGAVRSNDIYIYIICMSGGGGGRPEQKDREPICTKNKHFFEPGVLQTLHLICDQVALSLSQMTNLHGPGPAWPGPKYCTGTQVQGPRVPFKNNL